MGSSWGLEPGMALLAVSVLAVALRWTYGSRAARQRRAARPGKYGLLEHVALAPDRASAEALRAMLGDAGIRCTLAPHRDGDVELLVFPPDAERAKRLVRLR